MFIGLPQPWATGRKRKIQTTKATKVLITITEVIWISLRYIYCNHSKLKTSPIIHWKNQVNLINVFFLGQVVGSWLQMKILNSSSEHRWNRSWWTCASDTLDLINTNDLILYSLQLCYTSIRLYLPNLLVLNENSGDLESSFVWLSFPFDFKNLKPSFDDT